MSRTLNIGDSRMEFTASDFAARQEAFRKDLAEVLNRHSMENGSNTPDFLLADYLISCLRALDAAIGMRSKWYGRHDSPRDR